MADWELARVLRDQRDLVPEARSALDLEIRKRRLDPAQLHRMRPHSIDEPRHRTLLERKLGKKRIRATWLVAGAALGLVLAFVLGHFGNLRFYWPICITILVPVFTVWGHLELRKRPWFWVTIALIAMGHATAFFFVGWPWGDRWIPARSVEGLCTLDLMAIFAVISLVEKILHEDQDPLSAA